MIRDFGSSITSNDAEVISTILSSSLSSLQPRENFAFLRHYTRERIEVTDGVVVVITAGHDAPILIMLHRWFRR
jgi:hypothetical protein